MKQNLLDKVNICFYITKKEYKTILYEKIYKGYEGPV
jgi:hypothetical protein